MEQKSKTHIRPIVIVMIFAFITIGYAYLTSALNINGATLLKKATWDVHFENVQVKDGSVTGEQVIDEPEIDTDRTTVSFHINLKKPGDYYEFTVDAVNAGTIDAMINSYTEFDLTEDQLKYLETSVTYEDGEEIAEKQQLLAGDFAVYKIVVSFKKDLEADDLPDSLEQLDLEFTVEYVQKDDTAIERRAEIYSLYNVLKREAEGGGLALKYTGEHQDSMDSSKSTKNIYHWYADNNTDGTAVTNKNNVVFANHCWQMIRTTDTGGVKLLYNGEVENGKCLNTRGNHVGYASTSDALGTKPVTMTSNYWYGTDYTFDETSSTFKISGTIEQVVWSEITGPELIGKYTCKLTDENGSCSTLYLVESYYNTTSAYVLPLNSNSNYSVFGNLKFNNISNSPISVGYMYGDQYYYSYTYGTRSQSLDRSEFILNLGSLNTSYWYSDSIAYGTVSDGVYSLVNPFKIDSADDYQSLVGKYTLRSTNESYTSWSVCYIVAVSNNTMYYKQFEYGNMLSSYDTIVFGDSVTDNLDGTYTLNNAESISLSDWYTDYANYNEKYSCGDSSVTCSNPRYIISTTSNTYKYLDVGEKIMIAKGWNGSTLTDTLLVGKYELIMNSSNYSDYNYTCNSNVASCTEANLRFITRYNTTGYNYALNHYYGSSVTWDGNNYTLVDPIGIENYNNLQNLSTHHYICPNYGEKICSTVGYVYYYEGYGDIYYYKINNGVTTIEQVMDNMFKKNITNSNLKSGVDAWYKHYLLENFDNYIEDTIFCNDRSISDYGGWNPNGGMTNKASLLFKDSNVSKDLSCTNITDRFSVSNSNAQLTYKVGLLSSPELNLFNNNNARKNDRGYWVSSPYNYTNDLGGAKSTYVRIVKNDGSFNREYVIYTAGVRPAISLKPGTMFSSGDGSMANPYVIDTN